VHNANTGSTWSLSLLFSLVQELVPLGNADSGSFDSTLTPECPDGRQTELIRPRKAEKAAQVVERYNTFVRRVEELELIDAVDAKPILDVRTHISFPHPALT
jgi:tRNA nucleotidyltransferase (CCA-adding enzyme)